MFSLEAQDGRARCGRLKLAHGEVQTPVFMPVGTGGAVKTLSNQDLCDLGATMILSNTYHLYLRPGMEVLQTFRGLHSLMGWHRPILTDSGGFQIFSLAKLVKLSEHGVSFQSHLDGSSIELTPELAVEIQEVIGSDIHMVLDECTSYPVSLDDARLSMERSMRWAGRCRQRRSRNELCQFGIVQGSMYSDLRKRSAESLMEIGFEGYAIGGLSVGEPKEDMERVTEICCELLPPDRPRYLMGVGTPLDLLEAIYRGVDMFDCVMPTRNARNGSLFTSTGKINIKNREHRLSERALDEQCTCLTCQTHSRAYLRHLFISGEVTVLRMLTLHNLTFYLNLMQKAHDHIKSGSFSTFLTQQRQIWASC